MGIFWPLGSSDAIANVNIRELFGTCWPQVNPQPKWFMLKSSTLIILISEDPHIEFPIYRFLRPTTYFYKTILQFHNDLMVESSHTTNSSRCQSSSCVQMIKFGELDCEIGINKSKYLEGASGRKLKKSQRWKTTSTTMEYSVDEWNIFLKLTEYSKEYQELESKMIELD